MRKTFICVVCLSLSVLTAMAQLSTIDSLASQFTRQQGPIRIETANHLMELLLEEGYGDEVTFTAETPSDTVTMTVCYYVAEYFLNQRHIVGCLDMAHKALPLTEHHPDYTWQSETLNLLTQAYFHQSNYVEALRYAEQGYAVDSRYHDYGRMSSTLNTMAGIYLGARQPEQALQYINRAIEADQKTADHEHASAIYGIATEVYQSIGEYEKALDFARRAFALEQQRGNGAKAAIRMSQMAAAYSAMGDTAQAHTLLVQSIPVLQQFGVMPSLGISFNTLGEVMRQEGNTALAARYFHQANDLFGQTGDLYNRARSLHGLFAALYDTDPSQAMLMLDHYTKLKDTIYQNDMKQLLSNYSAKFRNDELQEENAAVRVTNRFIIIGGIVVVVLMLLALAALLYAMRMKSRSTQQLLDLQRTRENFFTNITHEFRTPLTIILGMGEKLSRFAADDSEADEVRQSGTIICRQGNQLLQLINELLDLSKAQAHVSNPEWRTDNIVAYLSMIIETFDAYAHGRGIELVYAPRENEVTMDFIPDAVQKIISNVISNAIKFTEVNGHINITSCLKRDRFVLQVADDGRGIDRHQLEHIFEPFYQASNNDGIAMAGTGVGLTLTRQLVLSMDGDIAVNSSRGKGTIITVTLPIRHEGVKGKPLSDDEKKGIAVLPYGDIADDQPLTDSTVTDDGDQTRVLIVEDSRDVARYIGSILSDRAAVFYTNDGRSGIEKALQLVPDLIITDLMMPGVDGLELCRQIRQNEITSHIPIIVITARTTHDDLLTGLQAGADVYLKKPFQSDELLLRVEKLLEQRRLLREKFSRTADVAETATEQLSAADAHFIGRVTDLVCSLMGRQQADVNTVASHLCMSPSQLRRKVQAVTGKTPAVYFLQIRLSNAQRLIDSQPNLSISEVATRCGFFDQAHFSHAFKEAYGLSPTQWAKRAK